MEEKAITNDKSPELNWKQQYNFLMSLDDDLNEENVQKY